MYKYWTDYQHWIYLKNRIHFIIQLSFQAEVYLYGFMEDANKRAGYCKFTVSTTDLPFTTPYNVITFRKNWRYTEALKYKFVSTFL